MNLFGQTIPPMAMALFAVAAFFLAGVYSFFKQGLKIAALVVLALAALAVIAAFGRM